MFEELWDGEDLEYTENRLRVHVLTLKKEGDPYPLCRLYGPLSLVLAMRGNYLAAQDALSDAEYLIVEHGWRGTDKETWVMADRAKTMKALGNHRLAERALDRAAAMATESSETELLARIEQLRDEFKPT